MFRIALVLILVATTTPAQDRRPSHCIAIADAAPGLEFIQRAAWSDTVPQYSVRISYIDHSMFLIQTPGGISVATDYTGYTGPAPFLPTAVTMNHAHSSHWTAFVDPGIPNVLPGWGPFGEGIEHYVDLGEMLIRNVSTDIRSGGGVEKSGNSIFIFEVEGLCVGHLGHLHHEPSEEQYAALGRLDVVMAAVDGGLTVPIPTMVRIIKRLRSSIVIPMHWFGRGALDQFLIAMSDDFEIDRTGETSLEVSLRTLPPRPTIMVLEPRFLD
ncbi:MAG: MBL fold metallo-hydrolase [Paracoccaceae bacterium]